MNTSIVKLTFSAPVHFGDGRLSGGESTCGADTLFSALFIEALSQGVSDSLLKAVKEGELILSDAFPWIGKTYYLPKPRYSPSRSTDDADDNSSNSKEKKSFKKLKFIPREAYPDFFEGKLEAKKVLDDFKEKIGKENLITKVNLERENRDEAEPYHVGSYSFHPGASGLYFLTQGEFDLEPLLDSLQYSGLGGKRSSGYGNFSYEVIEANDFLTGVIPSGLPHGAPGKLRVLLAQAFPKREELNEQLIQGAAYALKRRAGFIQSANYAPEPVKKKDFYLFAAGSTFTNTFLGDVYDVSIRGNHPVWRYAKAFWL